MAIEDAAFYGAKPTLDFVSSLFGKKKKKKHDDWTYDPSRIMQGSGFSYDPGAAPGGYPWPLFKGGMDTASLILQGTGLAEKSLIGGYEELFRARREGARSRQGELEGALGAEGVSQGLSEDTIRLLSSLGRVSGMGELSQQEGDLSGQLLMALAGLQKGTGSELASLRESQTQTMLDWLLGQKGIAAADKASKRDLWGSALGFGGGLLGGLLGGGGKGS